jgi:thiol-disulfide isomerase/thioredoxin
LSTKWQFALVGLLAALAGTALLLATRPPEGPTQGASDVSPAAVMAAGFRDLQGRPRSLGEFQGRVVVLNFWATWCAPCREEMPAFERLQAKWKARGVQFVGVSAEEGPKVLEFAKRFGVTYPLWVGGDEVPELSRRLGNSKGVLPHTVVFDRQQAPIVERVGAYPEDSLDSLLAKLAANGSEK